MSFNDNRINLSRNRCVIKFIISFLFCIKNLFIKIILSVDSSHETMSTITNPHSSSAHFNRHYFPYSYPFDHHQQMVIENNNQQRQITTINSSNQLLNHLNEDEHCQICGDLASGWHCG